MPDELYGARERERETHSLTHTYMLCCVLPLSRSPNTPQSNQVQRLQAAQQEQARRAAAAASEAAARGAELASRAAAHDALQLDAKQLRRRL